MALASHLQDQFSGLDSFLAEGMREIGRPDGNPANPANSDPASADDDFISPAQALKAGRQTPPDVLTPPSRAAVDMAIEFAQMDAHDASQALMVLALDEKGEANHSAINLLKGEMAPWIDQERACPESMSLLATPIARDVCAKTLALRYIAAARATASSTLIAPLPTGRWIAIAPALTLEAIPISRLVAAAHRQAIQQAQAKGHKYSEQALDHYRSLEADPVLSQ